ncbi:response regulator transcription factor [Streptosporangium sp. CA-135522]|uniref:response regulator transcription factor n=1 Tax=Streptosporangium sp. CA-135522 TaxID=3240072 RepID=UPI003D8E4737
MDGIRLLLAEDVRVVRGALVALLELEKDIDVVADVSSGDVIVDTALASAPDVAVIDIDLPGLDGLTAAARLHERLPTCQVLILTSLDRPGHLRRALAAHVAGFILKDASLEELLDAIRRVARGERVIDQGLAIAALRERENPLAQRELEVLHVAAEGADVPEIAERLFLSGGTVRNYLSAIVVKLDARNRIDAIRIARDAGWL